MKWSAVECRWRPTWNLPSLERIFFSFQFSMTLLQLLEAFPFAMFIWEFHHVLYKKSFCNWKERRGDYCDYLSIHTPGSVVGWAWDLATLVGSGLDGSNGGGPTAPPSPCTSQWRHNYLSCSMVSWVVEVMCCCPEDLRLYNRKIDRDLLQMNRLVWGKLNYYFLCGSEILSLYNVLKWLFWKHTPHHSFNGEVHGCHLLIFLVFRFCFCIQNPRYSLWLFSSQVQTNKFGLNIFPDPSSKSHYFISIAKEIHEVEGGQG